MECYYVHEVRIRQIRCNKTKINCKQQWQFVCSFETCQNVLNFTVIGHSQIVTSQSNQRDDHSFLFQSTCKFLIYLRKEYTCNSWRCTKNMKFSLCIYIQHAVAIQTPCLTNENIYAKCIPTAVLICCRDVLQK